VKPPEWWLRWRLAKTERIAFKKSRSATFKKAASTAGILLSFFFLEKSNQNSEEPPFFLSETDCFMPAIDRSHSLRRIGREDNMVETGDRGRVVDGVLGENPNGGGVFSNLTKGNNMGGRGFAAGTWRIVSARSSMPRR
jgi:hypothetical protein